MLFIERGQVNHEARTREYVFLLMVPDNVTHVLTEETLDAFSELLDAIDIHLIHPVMPVGVAWTGAKRRYLFRHLEVPRHIGHEIFDQRKRAHRGHNDRLFYRETGDTRHA